jgi:hypothetical protein
LFATAKLMRSFPFITLVFLMTITYAGYCQQNAPTKVAGIPVNYDETQVGSYTLPDPLTLLSGKKVTNTNTWMKKRRPEIVKLFEENQFGKAPAPPKLSYQVTEQGTPVFGGNAIRRQITIYLTKDTSDHKMNLLMYIPAKASKPAPMLLTISFTDNSLAVGDTAVKRKMVWREGKKVLATPSPRGAVNVEKYISAGIGYATVYYGDIEPDFKKGLKYGIRGVYLKPDDKQVRPNEWGASAAWSWGLSRAMDYIETDRDIDATHVAVTGASRLGKTALWAGASDTRFAMVIASISGECGAALSRRNFGETVAHMTDTSRYFYQFTPHYHDFADKVDQLPVDGHMLISLIAPRPLLLQTGSSDSWSDPKGEYLAAQAAEPVYNLFGKKGVGSGPFPAPKDDSMLNALGYYMHDGPHTVLPEDHDIFIRFMIKHFNLSGATQSNSSAPK